MAQVSKVKKKKSNNRYRLMNKELKESLELQIETRKQMAVVIEEQKKKIEQFNTLVKQLLNKTPPPVAPKPSRDPSGNALLVTTVVGAQGIIWLALGIWFGMRFL